jgi:hypothetical protein
MGFDAERLSVIDIAVREDDAIISTVSETEAYLRSGDATRDTAETNASYISALLHDPLATALTPWGRPVRKAQPALRGLVPHLDSQNCLTSEVNSHSGAAYRAMCRLGTVAVDSSPSTVLHHLHFFTIASSCIIECSHCLPSPS